MSGVEEPATAPLVPAPTGPDVAGPDVAGPDVAGPDVAGPDVAGPDVAGPAVPHGRDPASPGACPRCAAPTVGGDRFCETCGSDLRVHLDGTGAAARRSVETACPHCGDRSAPDGPEGFCPSCGLRRPDGTDHVETALDGAAAISDRGHLRPRNEDAVALGRGAVGPGAAVGPGVPAGPGAAAGGLPPVAAVVCDGVSSVPDSERAARAAADAAVEHLLRAGVDGERRTRAAVAAAASAAAGVVPPGTRNAPSCTLVCGVVDPAAAPAVATVTVGWVGDSRAYWLADGPGGPSRLLTRDHVAATAPPGTLDPVLVAARPDAITRWLGADGAPEPDVVTLTVSGPGLLLLCSDGLWKYLPDTPALAALALRAGGPAAVAAALVEAALAAGGEDNVTVAVIPVPLT